MRSISGVDSSSSGFNSSFLAKVSFLRITADKTIICLMGRYVKVPGMAGSPVHMLDEENQWRRFRSLAALRRPLKFVGCPVLVCLWVDEVNVIANDGAVYGVRSLCKFLCIRPGVVLQYLEGHVVTVIQGVFH
jgi:hypothetical protein